MKGKILIVGRGKSGSLNRRDKNFIDWMKVNHTITWGEYKSLSDRSKEYLRNEYNKCIQEIQNGKVYEGV